MSDVEGLAEVLWLADDYDLNADPASSTARELRPEYEAKARTILASPWLAARDQAARAEALEEAAATAIGCEHTDSMAWCHICDDWVTALRARAAALRADDAGWMHSCGGRERWYPLGARCVACGRKFGDEH